MDGRRIEIIVVGRDGLNELLGAVLDGLGPWYFVRGVGDNGQSIILAGPVRTLAELQRALGAVEGPVLPSPLLRELQSRIEILEQRHRPPARSLENRLVVLSSIGGGVAGVASLLLSIFDHVRRLPDEPKAPPRGGDPALMPGQELWAGLLYRRIPPQPGFWNTYRDRPTERAFLPASPEGYVFMHLAEFVRAEQLAQQYPSDGLCSLDIRAILSLCNYRFRYGALPGLRGVRVVHLPHFEDKSRVMLENVDAYVAQTLAEEVAKVITPPEGWRGGNGA